MLTTPRKQPDWSPCNFGVEVAPTGGWSPYRHSSLFFKASHPFIFLADHPFIFLITEERAERGLNIFSSISFALSALLIELKGDKMKVLQSAMPPCTELWAGRRRWRSVAFARTHERGIECEKYREGEVLSYVWVVWIIALTCKIIVHAYSTEIGQNVFLFC